MPLRVSPEHWYFLIQRISATSQWKLFTHFSSAQPDNVKQRGILLFKFSNSFRVSSNYATCYSEKNHSIDTLVLHFISSVPSFSSSHIFFPDKRQQNCLISDKSWIYFTSSVSVLFLKALVHLIKLKLAKSSLPLCYVERNLTSSEAEKYWIKHLN